jgi:hypothetical protein
VVGRKDLAREKYLLKWRFNLEIYDFFGRGSGNGAFDPTTRLFRIGDELKTPNRQDMIALIRWRNCLRKKFLFRRIKTPSGGKW